MLLLVHGLNRTGTNAKLRDFKNRLSIEKHLCAHQPKT